MRKIPPGIHTMSGKGASPGAAAVLPMLRNGLLIILSTVSIFLFFKTHQWKRNFIMNELVPIAMVNHIAPIATKATEEAADLISSFLLISADSARSRHSVSTFGGTIL